MSPPFILNITQSELSIKLTDILGKVKSMKEAGTETFVHMTQRGYRGIFPSLSACAENMAVVNRADFTQIDAHRQDFQCHACYQGH